MILSAQTIRHLIRIEPFSERTVADGMSYGLSSCGYDIRIKLDYPTEVAPGGFLLATSIERFEFPDSVMGMLADKSTWARRGVALQNTVFEPGWRGYPTLELSNHGPTVVRLVNGMPIGQMVFNLLDQPTKQPYAGKYQDQPQKPIGPIDG